MAKRSLFSILSAQPWWVSLLVAAIVFALIHLFIPQLALFVALPFIAVAGYTAYKQLRHTSPVDADQRLAALRAMPWEDFGLTISEAYRRLGYTVEESRSGAFDFTLQKNGRITLAQCRRWKVSQVGVAPLRKLYEAMAEHDAVNCVCITTGEFSANARSFVASKPITLLSGAALAELVGAIPLNKKH
jgi:restriction system protein